MRVAVLASGDGSNLQALLDQEAAGQLHPATVALVLCDRPGAHALQRARAADRPAVLVDRRAHASRDAFDAALAQVLAHHAIDLVVLAGFMRILGDDLVAAYPGRMINVHPSLLPAYPGLHAPAQALADGAAVTGATVHFVSPGPVDSGPIIAQVEVPIEPGDQPDALHQRIKTKERILLPEVVRLLARGAVSCEGRRVRIETP